jgi:hypothetical protein
MTTNDFLDQIKDSPELELKLEKDGKYYIEHTPSHVITAICSNTIETVEQKVLFDVLTVKREPVVLDTVSRIVGYFSRGSQWNNSKIAERADRRKGNYILDEQKEERA